MKGLFVKDLGYIGLSKRVFGIMMIMIVLVFFLRDGTGSDEFVISFLSSYIAIIFGMQVVTSISYDELNGGLAYILALPVSRNKYVYSKYLLALVSTFAGALIGYAASIVITGFGPKGFAAIDIPASIVGTLAVLGGVVIFADVMIPVQLKYGTEKGRMVLFIIVAVVVIGSIASVRIGKMAGYEDFDDIIVEVMKILEPVGKAGVAVIGTAIVALISAISIMISRKILAGKEF